jgi:cytochrome c oxidase accessory protein FixG
MTHLSWLAISVATGGALVFYFRDAPTLAQEFVTGTAPAVAYLFVGIFAGTTYLLGAIAREQVCIYMCPWPRIQGAMIDDNSLQVTYRYDRGEPRGPHKKADSWTGRGDCIDCKQCVVVCPQGIDIRDGLQLECINCALCIDACDSVMEKIGRPKGLIAYDTDLNIARRAKGEAPRFDFVRYRTAIYALSIVGVATLMLYSLATRQTLHLSVIRDRNPAFVMLSDGSVRNGYALKVVNMEPRVREVEIAVEDAPEAVITIPGSHVVDGAVHLNVAADAVTETHIYVALPTADLDDERREIAFRLTDRATGQTDRHETAFLSGGRRERDDER